jgi:hypothetical protein
MRGRGGRRGAGRRCTAAQPRTGHSDDGAVGGDSTAACSSARHGFPSCRGCEAWTVGGRDLPGGVGGGGVGVLVDHGELGSGAGPGGQQPAELGGLRAGRVVPGMGAGEAAGFGSHRHDDRFRGGRPAACPGSSRSYRPRERLRGARPRSTACGGPAGAGPRAAAGRAGRLGRRSNGLPSLLSRLSPGGEPPDERET